VAVRRLAAVVLEYKGCRGENNLAIKIKRRIDKTYTEIKLFCLTKELSCNTPNAGVGVILPSYIFRSSETQISIRRPPNVNEASPVILISHRQSPRAYRAYL